MNPMVESLVTMADEELRVAALSLPASTRAAALWLHEAAAKLLEAIVRIEAQTPDVPRGQIPALLKQLPSDSPFSTDVWQQIETSWAAEYYGLLIEEDGAIAPAPPESLVRDVLGKLYALVPAIRAYMRTVGGAESADPGVQLHCVDESRHVSPQRLARVLDIELCDLARMLRTSTVELRHAVGFSEVQLKLRDVVTILENASSITGDNRAAIHWFKSDAIPALGDKTAGELVGAGHGPAVIAYLELVDNGVYA